MSITDFLFSGKAPPSTTTFGTSVQNLPTWYSDYTQGLVNKANAIAAAPYQAYGGERLAGFTPQQEKAFGMADTAGGAYQPYLGSARDLATTAGEGSAITPGVKSLFTDAAGMRPWEMAKDSLTAAKGMDTGYQMGGDSLARAQGLATNIGTGALGSGLATANEYGLKNAGAAAMPGMQNYMNQYGNVLNPDLSALAKNQYNQLVQNTNDQFIGSGGFGGSRMGEALSKGAAQIAGNVAAQQANLQQAGLGQAASLAQGDLARQLQAGQAAAGIGQGDLARQLQAAGQLGSLGAQAGQLQQADIAQKLATAGQEGQLAGQTQAGLAGLAQTQGQFQQADLQRKLDAAARLSGLGSQASQLGLQHAAALESAGQTQQGFAQKGLDQKYQDFIAQREYPKEMTSYLNNIIRGLQIPTSQTTSQTGPAATYQPSPLAQIASAGATAAGLGKLFG